MQGKREGRREGGARREREGRERGWDREGRGEEGVKIKIGLKKGDKEKGRCKGWRRERVMEMERERGREKGGTEKERGSKWEKTR